jgi:signal transduction histidine kinase
MGATRIGCTGAAGLRLGSGSTRSRHIGRTLRAGIAGAPQLWALAALCASLVVVQQFHPLAFRAPTLRAIIETATMLSALAAACLFALSFGHRHRLRDLLLVVALVEAAAIDLVSYVIPAAIGIHSPSLLMSAPILGKLVMAATFAAAGVVPSAVGLPRARNPLPLALGAGLLVVALAELAGLLLLRGVLPMVGSSAPHGLAAAVGHPLATSAALAAAALLAMGAVSLARDAGGKATGVATLLAAGMTLFAAARLNFLVLPTPGIGWVTAREGLGLAGYALLLAATLRQEAAIRRAIGHAAASEERRRIARDLHDSLAQDLAFIAAHGDRIASEAGEDHPLAIAARRALAASRGAIADLSASDAPSTGSALRQVADELEIRFGIQVEVEADDADLSPAARDNVIRITREAIVNAAKGQAENVAVSLTRNHNRHVLRVLDNGAGIGTGEIEARPGFGLRTMRERAASLGGALTARSPLGGGTELEVVFP